MISVTKDFLTDVLKPHSATNLMHEACFSSLYGTQLKHCLHDTVGNSFRKGNQDCSLLPTPQEGHRKKAILFNCHLTLKILKFSDAFFKQHSSFLISNTQVTCFLLFLGKIPKSSLSLLKLFFTASAVLGSSI